MTVASWKFESGAVCNFTHGLVLHGSRYDTTLEVYCDGWSFRLVDPYKYSSLGFTDTVIQHCTSAAQRTQMTGKSCIPFQMTTRNSYLNFLANIDTLENSPLSSKLWKIQRVIR